MDIKTVKQIKSIIIDALKEFKKELKKDFATKNDLKELREGIKEDIAQATMDVFKAADKHKAEKENLKKLEKRVDQIEETLQISPL